MLVGIDFSLNSPGLCIQYNDGTYKFISFFNFGNRQWTDLNEKVPKIFSVHKELTDKQIILGFAYNRQVDSKDFTIRERQKLDDGHNIAELIIDVIKLMTDDESIKIALEGFSYGSKGNSFIDIVQYNTFLRSMLRDKYGSEQITVVQPSHVKKLAGKGNANKEYMINAFQDDVLNDSNLRKTKLWNWCKDKKFSEKISPPLSDLVDSYFILNTLKG